MRKIWLAAFSLALFGSMFVKTSGQTKTILLDDFESGSIRVVDPTQTDPDYRFLWNQYVNDFYAGPDPGVASIDSVAHDGTKGLKLHVTGGSLYLGFLPNNGTWHFMHEYTQPASGWTLNTYNRMRFWFKVPKGVNADTGGRSNFEFGTYLHSKNGDPYSAEAGGGHFYHNFNIPYTGEWHQIIVDWHPNHARSNDPAEDEGELQYPTGESGFNYFDALTRFYMDHLGSLSTYPADFYVDGFELYQDTNPENTAQIYSLNGVYVPSSNMIRVGWMRKKTEETVKHEVRYAFQDIFQLGWSAATPAPNGTVTPPGPSGYNAMDWSSTSVNVQGHNTIYVAIKPQNSSLFRQIAIPLTPGGQTTTPTPSAPTNVRVIR
jgi:hypothetical protein